MLITDTIMRNVVEIQKTREKPWSFSSYWRERRDTLCQVPISMGRQGAAMAQTAIICHFSQLDRYHLMPVLPVKKDAIHIRLLND